MNITLATAAHAALLTQLDAACSFSAHWNLAAWQSELAQPYGRVFSAWKEEQLIGFLVLRGVADQYEITNLAVVASQRQQGVGTALVQAALTYLRAQGGAHLTLEVSTQNLPAQALYRKAGFERLGTRKQFYKDGSDALILGRHV